MKKSIYYLFATLLMCYSQNGLAQNKLDIENVRSVYARSSGQIMDGEELKGYFVFYESDKIDKKTYEYTVQIMDNNLNKIKDIKFEADKNIEILESSYNGNTIMFLFYNDKTRTLEFRSYGFDGKQKTSYEKELGKRSDALLKAIYGSNSEDAQNENLFSVNNVGYVSVFPIREKKYYSYEVNFFFTDRKKQWAYEAVEEQEEKWANAQYLGATDSLLIFEIVKLKRLNLSNPHSWIVGINIFSGKKVFEFSTEATDYKFFPMNISKVNGSSNFLLLGTYYEPDGRIMKDASLGLAAWTFNTQGKIVSKKYNSWSSDIGKYLDVSKSGKVSDVGYIYFHKILQLQNGKFFAVGEGYKKVADGAGIAMQILAGATRGRSNASTVKAKITDLITFEFDENFVIKNATVYDKNSNSVSMPGGSEFLTPHTMALLVKAFGGFDYDFTQTDKAHTRFSIGYSDYVKDKEYKGRTFNAISYADGKTTVDKIELSSKAKWTRVFPAKPGSIMISEYFKKDKKLELRLEKIN